LTGENEVIRIENRRNKIKEMHKKLYREFLDECNVLQIFGINRYAEKVAAFAEAHGKKITAFIDDYRAGTKYMGVPVIQLNQANKALIVVNSVVEGRPKTVQDLLTQNGFSYVISYFLLNLYDSPSFPLPYSDENVEDIEHNGDRYIELYKLLADNTSQNLFLQLLDLRLNNAFNQPATAYRLQEQYWEPFIDFSKIGVFVDCGGFDGKTSYDFIQRNPNYKRVEFFEPLADCLLIAKDRFSAYKNIYFHQKAVFSSNAIARFTSNRGNANAIDKDGDMDVATCRLDDVLDTKVDMIKLDVEGAELHALKGGAATIGQNKPVLAVCCYHNQCHFWKIPELIFSIRRDYRLYLRHYTEGICETVMYFV
jgi:FkbM family methyltransferase